MNHGTIQQVLRLASGSYVEVLGVSYENLPRRWRFVEAGVRSELRHLAEGRTIAWELGAGGRDTFVYLTEPPPENAPHAPKNLAQYATFVGRSSPCPAPSADDFRRAGVKAPGFPAA